MKWTKKLEKEFCDEVIKNLNESQTERFLTGRLKYKNNPVKIDYEKEIQEELDDALIYGIMSEAVKKMFKITKK